MLIIMISALIVNGKHSPDYYLTFLWVAIGVLLGVFVVFDLFYDSLPTLNFWENKSKYLELKIQYKKLELKEKE